MTNGLYLISEVIINKGDGAVVVEVGWPKVAVIKKVPVLFPLDNEWMLNGC